VHARNNWDTQRVDESIRCKGKGLGERIQVLEKHCGVHDAKRSRQFATKECDLAA
jgi:hypothetical protein